MVLIAFGVVLYSRASLCNEVQATWSMSGVRGAGDPLYLPFLWTQGLH